jgi:hypothetical protein
MSAIMLPKPLEDWAEAEVAAGRAESVEALTVKAVAGYRRELEAFRATLDAASAEARAGQAIPLDAIIAEFEALYPDEA